MSLAFCNFLTVTQRMCLAVSPWTVVLLAWLDWDEKEKEQQRCRKLCPCPSPRKEEATDKIESKMTEMEILSVRNLPTFPQRKSSILSMDEDLIQDHHKYKLSIIWGMSLLCGMCSEQIMDQSKNPTCSLFRTMTLPVEIISIILTHPVPAVFAMSLCIVIFRLSSRPPSYRTRTNIILSFLYTLTILPSLLAELMDNGNNLSIIILLKFNLASIHIIFEPVVILYMRPELVACLCNFWSRENK